MNELAGSLFNKLFIMNAKKMMPDIKSSMFEKGTSGVRAQAMDSNGNLIMDFKVLRQKNQIHILNAPSPGATASLAIAEHIIDNFIK